jgi:hypothetical protein
MRKALYYIAFFGLLLLNSTPSHALALPHDAMTGVVAEQADAVPTETLSESDTIFHKSDVINDFDDFEEYDNENHTTSVKAKSVGMVIPNLSDFPPVTIIAKPFCAKDYSLLNFSRIPRYNYLSLRVLRI